MAAVDLPVWKPERGHRPRPVRARTIAVRRLTKHELELGRGLYPEAATDYWRPTCRGDCAQVERPCPFVGCRHHLYLDVNEATGSIKLNFPDIEPWELEESCALDLADAGGLTLEDVGEVMNLTRERIRQIELEGLERLRRCVPLREHADGLFPIEKLGPSEREVYATMVPGRRYCTASVGALARLRDRGLVTHIVGGYWIRIPEVVE